MITQKTPNSEIDKALTVKEEYMEARNSLIEDYTPIFEQNFGKVGSLEWIKRRELSVCSFYVNN